MKTKQNRDETRLIRLREVMEKTGLSRSYVYDLTQKGQFPQTVKLSERSRAWVESEVQDWINERIIERNIGGLE